MQKINRRKILSAAAGACAGYSLIGSRSAFASPFPNRPINLIIPEAPGGTFDSYGREFSRLLQDRLKVNVEPINMPGAGGAEAIFSLFSDAADGYTISLIGIPGGLMHNPRPDFDFKKLTWLANLSREPYGLAVGTHSPIKNFSDLLQLASTRPVAFSIDGPGSTGSFLTKIFIAETNLRSKIVTGYQGSSAAVLAVARGEADATVQSLTTIKKMQSASLAHLIFQFENVPAPLGIESAKSIGKPELGEIFQWRSIVAPPGLPQNIAAGLSAALLDCANSSEAQQWAHKIHAELFPLGQAETLKMVATQEAIVKKWRPLL
jgi:tripartite-type tricarboxylate transporter receptor subunit TctC